MTLDMLWDYLRWCGYGKVRDINIYNRRTYQYILLLNKYRNCNRNFSLNTHFITIDSVKTIFSILKNEGYTFWNYNKKRWEPFPLDEMDIFLSKTV